MAHLQLLCNHLAATVGVAVQLIDFLPHGGAKGVRLALLGGRHRLGDGGEAGINGLLEGIQTGEAVVNRGSRWQLVLEIEAGEHFVHVVDGEGEILVAVLGDAAKKKEPLGAGRLKLSLFEGGLQGGYHLRLESAGLGAIRQHLLAEDPLGGIDKGQLRQLLQGGEGLQKLLAGVAGEADIHRPASGGTPDGGKKVVAPLVGAGGQHKGESQLGMGHNGAGVSQQQVGKLFGGIRGTGHHYNRGLKALRKDSGLELLKAAAGFQGLVAGKKLVKLLGGIPAIQRHCSKGLGDVEEGGEDIDKEVGEKNQKHHAEKGKEDKDHRLDMDQARGGDLQLEGLQVVPAGMLQLVVHPAGGEKRGAVRQDVAAFGILQKSGLEIFPVWKGQRICPFSGDNRLAVCIHNKVPVLGKGAQKLAFVPIAVNVQQHGAAAPAPLLRKDEGIPGLGAGDTLKRGEIGMMFRMEENLHRLLVVKLGGGGGAVAALRGEDDIQAFIIDHNVVNKVAAAGKVPQVPVADGPFRPGEIAAGAQGADGGGVEHLHSGGADVIVGKGQHRVHIVAEALVGGGDTLEGGGAELEEEEKKGGEEGEEQKDAPAHLNHPPVDAGDAGSGGRAAAFHRLLPPFPFDYLII